MADTIRAGGIPGLVPPEILIFLRLPKTGGNTMDGLFEHCLPGQFFHAYIKRLNSPLLVRPTDWIEEKFLLLPPERRARVRCLIGNHVAMDVDRIFDRPASFFTVVREPVDRVVSHFYHVRTEPHVPIHRFIRTMTLEQYLDSGMALEADNLQVRVLSGCAELDGEWHPQTGQVTAAPVTPHHLEMAKRNIETRFIAAAALEQITQLVWFFKRLYGWPTHQVLFLPRNENAGHQQNGGQPRPRVADLPASLRERLERSNHYDRELYLWVKQRFTDQLQPLQPEFDKEVSKFNQWLNIVHAVANHTPSALRRLASRALFSRAPDLFSGVELP